MMIKVRKHDDNMSNTVKFVGRMIHSYGLSPGGYVQYIQQPFRGKYLLKEYGKWTGRGNI
jgi:hypothetical protein